MVNAYLVREDDGLTLIDTMIGGSAGKVGSLDELKENLPQVEVIISARDARLLART
jgi:flavorubredoxin